MSGGKEIMVTNDGATILKSLYVDNPAAKVLVGERPLHVSRGSDTPVSSKLVIQQL